MFKQLCVPSHTGRIAANLSHDLHRLAVNAQIGYTHGISVRSSGNGMKSITRAFSTSVSCAKALPFSLGANASVGTTQGGLGVERRGGETLRMIMFGKPGAGKGTLSERLVKKYDIVALSTGDLLRQHIAQKTEVGRQAEEIVARGDLLPDELMLKVVTSKLDLLNGKHWILDGFPRTLGQGKLLDTHLRAQGDPLTLVINLSVADSVILSRISDRWIHIPSGRVYNLSYNPPKIPGRDDLTGEALSKRPDDNPEIFARRLETYYKTTAPLMEYYAEQSSQTMRQKDGKLRMVTLTGETSDEIWPNLESAICTLFPMVSLRERADESVRRRSSLTDPFTIQPRRATLGKAVNGPAMDVGVSAK